MRLQPQHPVRKDVSLQATLEFVHIASVSGSEWCLYAH